MSDESTLHWLKEARRYKDLCTKLTLEIEGLKQQLVVLNKRKKRA